MSNGAPKSANANRTIRVADGCFRVECDPLPGFSHELPGASPVYGTLRFTPAERVRAPRCSEIWLVNVGKAHFNHHFSVRDPFAIATALSFTRNDSQWPATHRHCKTGNVDSWPLRKNCSACLLFFPASSDGKSVYCGRDQPGSIDTRFSQPTWPQFFS